MLFRKYFKKRERENDSKRILNQKHAEKLVLEKVLVKNTCSEQRFFTL